VKSSGVASVADGTGPPILRIGPATVRENADAFVDVVLTGPTTQAR
jgi:hypothetical protein